MAERRIDPADNQAYTWDELEAKYKGTYSVAELGPYWTSSCKPAPAAASGGVAAGGAKRVDPVDYKAYTYAEFKAKYQATYSPADIDSYWNTCKEDEKRVDPADQIAYTWDEIETKYKGTYTPAVLARYWDQSCTKAPAGATSPAAAAAPAAGGGVKKVDPADGKAYTWPELLAKYQGVYQPAEVEQYWRSTCQEDEKRIDPDDQKAYTWAELQAKYSATYAPSVLASYWSGSCTKAPPSATQAGMAAGAPSAAGPAVKYSITYTKDGKEKKTDPYDKVDVTRERLTEKYKDKGACSLAMDLYFQVSCKPPEVKTICCTDGRKLTLIMPTNDELKEMAKRKDPVTKACYTWDEALAKFEEEKGYDGVMIFYWKICHSVETKLDPEDCTGYALEESHTKYANSGLFDPAQVSDYFQRDMISMPNVARPEAPGKPLKQVPNWKVPTQRKEDPSSREYMNFEELEKKYKGQQPLDELRSYWDRDCRWVETKVDLQDRCGYTLMEMHAKFTTPGHCPPHETIQYWEQKCKPLEDWVIDYRKGAPYTQADYKIPRSWSEIET